MYVNITFGLGKGWQSMERKLNTPFTWDKLAIIINWLYKMELAG